MTTGTSIPHSGRAGGPDRAAEHAASEALKGQAPVVERQSRTRDAIVALMMALVSAAIGATLHFKAGLSVPLSAFGAGVAFAVSLTANALAARSSEVSRLRFEIARLEMELARIKTGFLTAPVRDGEAGIESAGAKPAGLPPEARWDAGAARRPRMTPPAATTPGAQATAVPPAGTATGSAVPAAAAQAPSPAPQRWQQPNAGTPAEVQGAPKSETASRDRPVAPATGDSELPEVPAWAAPSQAQADAMREDWEAAVQDKTARRMFEQMPAPEAARVQVTRTIEADLELVQRKIKALADEVNANEALRTVPTSEGASSAAIDESVAALRTTADRMKPARKGFASRPIYTETSATSASAPAPKPVQTPPVVSRSAPPAQGPGSPAGMPAGSASARSQPAPTASSGTLPSLDALIPATAKPIAVSNPVAAEPARPAPAPPAPRQDRDEWARDMREERRDFAPPPEPPRQQRPVESQRPARSGPAPASAQAPATVPGRYAASDRRQSDRRFAEIAAAIEQRRMDVFLNPIVGLGDYAVTHFEVDVRLRGSEGGYIDDVQQTLSLHATDLLALFDIERLARTAQVGEQLEARGKTGSLLSPTAGHSMTDGKFLEAFAQTFEARTSISGQLVLTFTQADVSSFGPSTWQALSDMHSFGFRFALEHVTHLGMDFALLADRGFAFVKLPAEAFLDGLPAGHGTVPPADICRHLSGAGMTLVVESINDDQLLARVFGFGALFGQGTLFGGSRQITLEALGPKRAA